MAFHGPPWWEGSSPRSTRSTHPRSSAHQLKDASAKYLLTLPPFWTTRARPLAAQLGPGDLRLRRGRRCDAVRGTSRRAMETMPAVRDRPRERPHRPAVLERHHRAAQGCHADPPQSRRRSAARSTTRQGRHDRRRTDVAIGILPFFHIYGMVVLMNLRSLQRAQSSRCHASISGSSCRCAGARRLTFSTWSRPSCSLWPSTPWWTSTICRRKLVSSGRGSTRWKPAARLCRTSQVSRDQGYGMTETSPACHVTPQDPAKVRSGAAGLTLPNMDSKVVDTVTGATLPRGERGEIWVRGPMSCGAIGTTPRQPHAPSTATDGYTQATWAMPTQTATSTSSIESRSSSSTRACRWPRRSWKRLLLSHPAVADVAVIPSPDEEAGEVPKAFVVLRQPVPPTELMDWVAGRVRPTRRSGGWSDGNDPQVGLRQDSAPRAGRAGTRHAEPLTRRLSSPAGPAGRAGRRRRG